MPNQLESALVIRLRSTFRWESAIQIATSGTLQPVNPYAAFSASDYQQRDRELAFRDLINAAAVVDASVHISDVWHAEPAVPTMEGPVNKLMPHAPAEVGTSNSLVRHVRQTSVPAHAFQQADKDLYGRDILIYEVLARACQELFEEQSPLTSVASGTVAGTHAWSLAQGLPVRADIATALPLNRELFKSPDRNLAERDNQMAGYVSRIVQVLKNPFEHAERLYVSVSGGVDREAEVYVLIASDDAQRVWGAEPGIVDRNRFIYRIAEKTLQWLPQTADSVHVPQIFALAISGVLPGQSLNTLPQVPEGKDAQFWRLKASQIIPAGDLLEDVATLDFTATDEVVGGVTQFTAASFTVPDMMQVTLPIEAALSSGAYRITVLATPNPVVEIIGAQNASGVGGDDGGATYALNVPSGAIEPLAYLVYGDGDGVIYNGITYLPGDLFFGASGTTAFTSLSGSKVRQAATSWSIPLAPGGWLFSIDYTNISGSTTGFGIQVKLTEHGKPTVGVIEDVVPLPFYGEEMEPLPNLTVVRSPLSRIEITETAAFNMPILWTYGDGQLQIRSLRFERTDLAANRYAISGTLAGASAGSDVDVLGTANVPDVLVFDYGTVAPVAPPVTLDLIYSQEAGLPLRIEQVQVQRFGAATPTPLTESMQGWRYECLQRAARAAGQSYAQMIQATGDVPTFDAFGTWDTDASEAWMSFIEVAQPRLREIRQVGTDAITPGRQYKIRSGTAVYGDGTFTSEQLFYGVETSGTVYAGNAIVDQVGAFRLSGPGHIGKPGLFPTGLRLDSDGIARVETSGSLYPVLATIQPWMVSAGLYVASEDFWQPDELK